MGRCGSIGRNLQHASLHHALRRGHACCRRARLLVDTRHWPDQAHHVELGIADAPADQERGGGLGRAGRKGHQRPRQAADAAQTPVRASRHLRRGQGRPGRRVLRHRQLHARPPHSAAAARAAGRRTNGHDQLDRLLAHLLEASARSRRVQGRQAARRLHPRAGADVQHQAPDHEGRGLGRHEDPLRWRHLRGDGARARCLGVRQAGA